MLHPYPREVYCLPERKCQRRIARQCRLSDLTTELRNRAGGTQQLQAVQEQERRNLQADPLSLLH
jgi:hypothetical protein